MAQQIVIEVPGTKISELEETSSVNENDVLPVVQNDETKKAPLKQIALLVKAGLGSAALKNESDFATPASVASASQASQARDDAQNERIDNVEFGLVSIANGSDRSFATYAEMVAYVPPNANVTVRNNDTDPALKGTYIWTGTAYVPGYDPLDAAIEYVNTSLKAEDKENLYDPLNSHSGINVNPTGGALRTSSNVEINIFPIVGGKTYSIKTLAEIDKRYVVIGVSSSNSSTAGTTTQLVTLQDTADPLIKTFVAPQGANFGYINTYWSVVNVDLRNNLIISSGTIEKVVKKVQGKDIFDEAAHVELEKLNQEVIRESDIEMNVIDLYSTDNEKPGLYVNRTGNKISTYTTSSLVSFQVEAGKTYYITSPAFLTNSCVGLKNDEALVAETPVFIVLLQDHENGVKKFTVPVGSDYKYAFFTTHLSSQTYDVRANVSIQDSDNPAYVVSIKKAKILAPPSGLEERMNAIEEMLASINTVSPLWALNWVVGGDSITEKNFRTVKNYHDFVSEDVGGMNVYNFGISGTGWTGRTDLAFKIKDAIANNTIQPPNLITTFFGTNDFGIQAKPLGVFGDNTTDTVAGGIYLLLHNLITEFPTTKIAVFTPLPRYNSWGVNGGTPNAFGVTLRQISEMIIQHCIHFGIPYLDLYSKNNLYVFNADSNAYFFTYPGASAPDGVHPNDAGHRVIAYLIKSFLEALFGK